VDRERVNRTRFAQRALKPEDVQRELEATDAVLGDPSAVRDFVLETGTELEFVIMVIAVSCVKLLSAHNSTQHTSRKHKV
jgi:hypothetical protein